MARVPSRQAWLLAVALMAQAAVVLGILQASPTPRPHLAPIIVVAAPIVSGVLVQEANALPGRPFEARPGASQDQALPELEAGAAVGVVVVDLATQHDLLFLAEPNGDGANAAVRSAVEAVSASRGRTLEVRTVAIPGSRPAAPYLLVLVCTLLGFAAAVVSTWRRGPMDASMKSSTVRLRRFVAMAAACAGLAALAAMFADVAALPTFGLAFLVVLVAAVGTTALESLLDTAGLAVATVLFALTAAPLARLVHPILLAEPWATLFPWLPHGAGLAIARSILVFHGTGAVRDWALLLAYLGLSVATITTARRARRRAGVPVRPPLTAGPARGAGRPS